MFNLRLMLFFAAALWAVPATEHHVAAAPPLAIKNARIIPVVGEPIEKGTVIMRDGKITQVGKELSIPIEAKVINGEGKVVLPGFVDVHNSAAMSQANERNPNVPFLSVVDSIDPSRTSFEDARRNGITTIAVVPGNSTMIGGQAAIIKSSGQFVDDMLLKRKAGLKISLSPTSGRSRMSHLAGLRRELEKARLANEEAAEKAEEEKQANEKKKKEEPEKQAADDDEEEEEKEDSSNGDEKAEEKPEDLQIKALQELLQGDVPAFIYCPAAMDVLQALKLSEKYNLQSILVLGQDCYRAAEQIAASKLPVVLDPTLVFWEEDPRSGEDRKISIPEVYHRHGIPMTFQIVNGLSSSIGTNYLWYQAATAMKYGVSREDALHSITLRPAEILGIAKFVGSIEAGKDADLVVLTGDPFALGSWVETTIVAGEVVYEREKDERLKELLEPQD